MDVKIDFDEASRAWRLNKLQMQERKGVFVYCCGFIKPNGQPCQGPPGHWNKRLPQRDWSRCKRHHAQDEQLLSAMHPAEAEASQRVAQAQAKTDMKIMYPHAKTPEFQLEPRETEEHKE